MLKRKIKDDLTAWKNKPNKKALVVKGARQIGKTYIIEEFCRENYKNVITIAFIKQSEYKEIFVRNLEPETIYKRISAMYTKANLGIYKGAIYENIIADVFTKLGKKLYYYGIPSKLEIDFFIRKYDTAVAVEVKSADNAKSRSMETLIGHHGVKRGIKLSSKNIGVYNNIESIPLYMAIYL